MAGTRETMTFAKRVKNELALNYPTTVKGQRALLSGFARQASSLSIGSNPVLTFRTEIANAAKMAFNLLKDLYSLSPNFVFERKMRFDKNMVYLVRVRGECIYDVMEDLRVTKNLRPVPLRSMINQENIQRFMQGLFIASGSVNAPESKSYFLEIALTRSEDATAICQALYRANPRFTFKTVAIRDHWMIYLKRSSEIAEFLAWIGATNSSLEYESARVEKDFLNSENRLNICLAHNLSKSIRTAHENLKYTKVVTDAGRQNSLDYKTRAVMQARLDDSEANYQEIAEKLTSEGISMTKSGVARAFARIRELAESIGLSEEEN